MRLRHAARGLVLLATLVAVGWAIESGALGGFLSRDWIDHEVRGKGVPGELLFLAVGALACAVAVPRQVVSFLGGHAFGAVLGTLLALVATEIGCVLVFFLARIVGRPLVAARFGPRVRRIEAFLAANPFAMTLVIRLLPVGNNFATCAAAGVTRVPALPFLAGSLLGYLPQTLAFALAGSGVEAGTATRIATAAALLLVASALGAWLARKYRHDHFLATDRDDHHPDEKPH